MISSTLMLPENVSNDALLFGTLSVTSLQEVRFLTRTSTTLDYTNPSMGWNNNLLHTYSSLGIRVYILVCRASSLVYRD